MAHYAHYLRRDLVQPDYANPKDPWFAENQPDDQGFEAPAYHTTRSIKGPATRISAGDTVWLFSRLSTPWGKFPPALDAKISVCAISDGLQNGKRSPPGFRYEAANDSQWFPLCDATHCILSIRTLTAAGCVQPLLTSARQSIGQALQSIRELASPGPLIKWALEIEARPLHFVSYRLLDGTRSAFDKAISLVEEGRAIFWDRWSLPRRLAERREFVSDHAMEAYINSQISRSRTVWGIYSPRYAEPGSYSAREMQEAQRQGKLQKWMQPDDEVRPLKRA